jgi:hypothetical protein
VSAALSFVEVMEPSAVLPSAGAGPASTFEVPLEPELDVVVVEEHANTSAETAAAKARTWDKRMQGPFSGGAGGVAREPPGWQPDLRGLRIWS